VGNMCRMSSKLRGAGCVINYVAVVVFSRAQQRRRENGNVYSVAE